jgi:NAD dependent epimerase/dehydratase family enzyme
MPWIGAHDLVVMYIYALEQESLTGVYNTAVANPTQREFMKTVANAVHTPISWPIPALIARLLYLDFADALLVDTTVDNTKIISAGFVYNETDLYTTIVSSINE